MKDYVGTRAWEMGSSDVKNVMCEYVLEIGILHFCEHFY